MRFCLSRDLTAPAQGTPSFAIHTCRIELQVRGSHAADRAGTGRARPDPDAGAAGASCSPAPCGAGPGRRGPFAYINFSQGRIIETATYPTATFELTEPINLQTLPADGETVTATADGELTLHGTTRAVTVEVAVQRSGDTVNVSGSIPVTFSDYGIANPSFGPVTTEDNGEVEFLLALTRG